ncbi:hypothetical protein J6C36_02930, partial [Methanocorpusculaceae archaeon]|nr:hypothetical protein [Methanocorpusculaceae archaeon]
DFQFDSNNKSDSEFFQEHIEKIGPQEEKTIISTDGAYSGEENTELAANEMPPLLLLLASVVHELL